MTDPNRKPGGIRWERANLDVLETPQPRPRGKGAGMCRRCAVGDCHLCVRVGCYHPCPGMRKHGLSVGSNGAEHGAPGPGRA